MEYEKLTALLDQMAEIEDRLDAWRETLYRAIALGDARFDPFIERALETQMAVIEMNARLAGQFRLGMKSNEARVNPAMGGDSI